MKRLSGPDLILNVNGSDSIMDVKLKIQNQSDIPPDQQRLIFAEKQLENHRTLADYNIKDKYELKLVGRLQPFMINPRFKEHAAELKIPPDLVAYAERAGQEACNALIEEWGGWRAPTAREYWGDEGDEVERLRWEMREARAAAATTVDQPGGTARQAVDIEKRENPKKEIKRKNLRNVENLRNLENLQNVENLIEKRKIKSKNKNF